MSSGPKRGRRYSSSASPRRRSRSRSGDSYYSYSDSFASDTGDDRKKKGRSTNSHNKSSKLAAAYKSKKQAGKQKTKNTDTRSSDQTTQRMLSARRLKINDLRSENEELRQLLDEAKTEAKTLKTSQRRQEKALEKFESQESDLSNIISRHNEEVRSLKDQIRKYRSKTEQTRRQYLDMNDDFNRVKSENKKLKALVEKKELQERGDLDRKLTNAEIELDQKEKKIRELERHIENLTKNHKHELAIEMHRHKDTRAQLDAILQQNNDLEKQLEAKTRAIDVTNIYSNRGRQRPLSPASSRSHLPTDPLVLATPRDKAERTRLYEQRRREKVRRKQEAKQRLDEKRREEDPEQHATAQERIQESSDEEPKWEHDKAEKLKFSFKSDPRQSRDVPSDDEFFETKKRVESPVVTGSYEPTYEKKSTPGRDSGKRERVSSARRSAKSRSPSPPPARERTATPRTPTPPREPSPPPREPTPPPRDPTPPPRDPTPPPRDPTPPPRDPTPPKHEETPKEEPNFAEQRRKKDLLLARLRALDDEKYVDADEESPEVSDKPRYSFSKPVDNLHQGVPTHDDVKVPYLERQKRRQSLQNDSSSSLKNTKNNANNIENAKKQDLMASLFGDTNKDSNVEKQGNNKRNGSLDYDVTNGGYQPSVGARPPARHHVINKPVVNAVDDHVHEDEIEEFIL